MPPVRGRTAPYLIPTAVLVLMLGALNAGSTGFVTVDTYNLLTGTGVAAHCIDRGVWSACGGDVSTFALLQYLPALVFHAAGFSYLAARDGLVMLNGLACLGVLALVALAAKRRAGTSAAACCAAVMLASPFVWYSNAGFGEPLAALAVTALAVSIVLRWPAAVSGTAMLLACVSKETAFPLVLAVVVAAWLIRRRDGGGLGNAEIISIAAGALTGIALNLGFNVFRYGHIGNDVYLESAYHVGPGMAAENLVALALSPTAGLLFMWPGFVAVSGAGLAFALRRRSWVEPGVAAFAVLGGAALVAAAWYSPFGAVAWGPRLLLPWLPAVMVLFVAAYPAELGRAIDALLGNSRRFALVVLLTLVTGAPQVLASVDTSRYAHNYPGLESDRHELVLRPYATDAACPEVPDIEARRDYFFHCFRRFVWRKGLVPASTYGELRRPRELVYCAAWCLAMIGLLQLARERAQRAARA